MDRLLLGFTLVCFLSFISDEAHEGLKRKVGYEVIVGRKVEVKSY